jgi:hypothetical protein
VTSVAPSNPESELSEGSELGLAKGPHEYAAYDVFVRVDVRFRHDTRIRPVNKREVVGDLAIGDLAEDLRAGVAAWEQEGCEASVHERQRDERCKALLIDGKLKLAQSKAQPIRNSDLHPRVIKREFALRRIDENLRVNNAMQHYIELDGGEAHNECVAAAKVRGLRSQEGLKVCSCEPMRVEKVGAVVRLEAVAPLAAVCECPACVFRPLCSPNIDV